MDEHLTTGQVELLSGAKPFTAGEYDKLGVLSPRRIGTGRGSRLWTRPQALALCVAQVLMRVGMRGQPIYGAMRLVAKNSEGDLHRIYESAPLLGIFPGVAVVARWLGREEFATLAWEFLDEIHVHPFVLDVEKLHKRMDERIAWFNEHGWQTRKPQESAA